MPLKAAVQGAGLARRKSSRWNVGAADGIIPPARSRALFDAWAGPKKWVAIPGAGHNDLHEFEAYRRVLRQALDSNDPQQYPILNAINLEGARLRVHWAD